MTADEFCRLLGELRARRIAMTDKEAAVRLGLHPQRIGQMKKSGTRQLQTDLAAAALLAGLEPYPGSRPT